MARKSWLPVVLTFCWQRLRPLAGAEEPGKRQGPETPHGARGTGAGPARPPARERPRDGHLVATSPSGCPHRESHQHGVALTLPATAVAPFWGSVWPPPTPNLSIPACPCQHPNLLQTFGSAMAEVPQSGTGHLLRAPTQDGLTSSRSRVDPGVSPQVTPTWRPSCFLPRGKPGLQAASRDRRTRSAAGAAAREGRAPRFSPHAPPGTPGSGATPALPRLPLLGAPPALPRLPAPLSRATTPSPPVPCAAPRPRWPGTAPRFCHPPAPPAPLRASPRPLPPSLRRTLRTRGSPRPRGVINSGD